MKTYRATLYYRDDDRDILLPARSFQDATLALWKWLDEGNRRYRVRALVEVSEPAEQLPLDAAG